MNFRDVQQPGHAESTAADLRKPSADAEHAVCSLHAQYDAVTGSKSRVGLPGTTKKDVAYMLTMKTSNDLVYFTEQLSVTGLFRLRTAYGIN